MSVSTRQTAFCGGAALLIVAAITWAIVSLGSPREQRVRALDERRKADLRTLSQWIESAWTRNNRLPASIDDMVRDLGFVISVRDPESGARYEYRPIDERRYELCATFARPSGNLQVPVQPDARIAPS